MTLAFKARVQDPTIASHRYRVLAPIRFLAARGHAVELYDPSRRRRYDTVVFSKAYRAEDRALAKRLRAAGQEVVLDLCDDHFYNPEGLAKYAQVRDDLMAMIALADRVTCSTPVLAASVQRHAGLAAAPAVAPDVYEQAQASAAAPTPLDRPARLLWYGRHGSPNAPSGMGDLRLIQAHLVEAFARRPFELAICSDSSEAFDRLAADLPFPTRYVAWSPAALDAELGSADAVVIPLSDNPFVAAKTHNRLTLALSAGLPVVADPLDAYREFHPFCWLGDWAGGLEAVLLRPDEARARAALARPYLEAHWSEAAVAPLWETALGLQAGPRRPGRRPAGALSDVWSWLGGRAAGR